jgi:phosphoserine phosphatase
MFRRPLPRSRWTAPLALLSALLALPVAAADDPLAGWSPEVRSLLREVVAKKAAQTRAGAPRPVAAFDCDNTLIDGDISFNTMVFQAGKARYAFPAGQSGPLDAEGARLLAEARAGKGGGEAAAEARIAAAYRGYHVLWESAGKQEACGYLARMLEGMTFDEAVAMGRDAMAAAEASPRCVRRIPGLPGQPPVTIEQGLRIRKPMEGVIAFLREAGWEIYVVSASALPLVTAVAARYGVDADHVLGVRTALKDGRLAAEVLPPVTWRQGKVDALKSRLGNRRPALAFGDSWTDFEMLTDAEHAVLVDRGKADLREALKAKGVLLQQGFEGPEGLPACDAPEQGPRIIPSGS